EAVGGFVGAGGVAIGVEAAGAPDDLLHLSRGRAPDGSDVRSISTVVTRSLLDIQQQVYLAGSGARCNQMILPVIADRGLETHTSPPAARRRATLSIIRPDYRS